MRRHSLIAVGISIALLLGVAAFPALAGPGVGRIKGAARTANVAWLTVEVRQDQLARGRLDYTSVDGRFKVRCRGFEDYIPSVVPGPRAATVSGDCTLEGPRGNRTAIEVDAEFVDRSSFIRRAKDEVNLTFTLPDEDEPVTDTGRILSGDITVR